MTEDARFEDGREAPLYLGALDSGDLQVISSLVQDAVFPITEMQWYQPERQFALLLNRVRWEDQARERHGVERVQSILVVSGVLNVSSQGLNLAERDLVLSVLSVEFDGEEDAAGDVLITLAGDGAIRISVEALEVQLRDVTRPFRAPSGHAPDHDL